MTLEAANPVYTAMVLQILDYCDIVWHEPSKGNDNMVKRLQRRAVRIVYSSTGVELSTDEIITKLGWEPLNECSEAHVLSLVKKCVRNNVPSYLQDYFKLCDCQIHNNMYNTRNGENLILGKVNLKCTQQSFFYKGARIFKSFSNS